MSVYDDSDGPWWDDTDEDVSDDARRILEERTEEESVDESEEQEQLVEIEESEDEELEEELEEEDQEQLEEEHGGEAEWDDRAPDEISEDEHLAPGNEPDGDWELAHHFDFYEDAVGYVSGVAVGVRVRNQVLVDVETSRVRHEAEARGDPLRLQVGAGIGDDLVGNPGQHGDEQDLDDKAAPACPASQHPLQFGDKLRRGLSGFDGHRRSP